MDVLRRGLRTLLALAAARLPDPRARRRRQDVIAHRAFRAPVIPHLIVPDVPATPRDVEIAERLLRAWRRAMADHRTPAQDLWTLVIDGQRRFLELLRQGDPRTLAAYLCNMSRHDATLGTVQGEAEHARLLRDGAYRAYIARMAKDKLVSLAEAVGVLPCENPESGPYGESLHLDAGLLAGRISAAVGLDITPPPIDGGLLKIRAGEALFGERDLNAVFTALGMRGTARICEIGGGSGRVAYWSHRLGARSYALVDLPHVNVVQGFYLLKALPDGAVSLHGEPAAAVAIHPCDALPEGSFDLVLNQDSFPEIGRDTVLAYLDWIADHAAAFLSINHESQGEYPGGRHLRVLDLVRETGRLELVERIPYWLRKGYVRERYRPVAAAPGAPARAPG